MPGPEIEKKLAAILAADVAGYTRLMADDERATIDTIADYRRHFRGHIEANGGRVVDMSGDSVLALFSSTEGAVAAAVATQKELGRLNAALPKARRMDFRIGVNLGDVQESADGTVYGEGVNIAARLEGLAEPGGVTLSEDAWRQVRRDSNLTFADAGRHTVKNVDDPIHAYRLLGDDEIPAKTRRRLPFLIAMLGIAVAVVVGLTSWLMMQTPEIETASLDQMAFPLPEEPSIAVLPFDNLSGDDAYEYLADGLSENIISALAQIRSMMVVSRNSTFSYKGRAVKAQLVAEELGIRYVLEGSIQVGDNRVRVTAQLIDALDGTHLWSERYDRELGDIFAVQDEITLNVASALQLELTEGRQALAWRGGTNSLEAWSLYQRGRDGFLTWSNEGLEHAIDLFQRATEVDPEYALAWANLCSARRARVMFRMSEDPQADLSAARDDCERAVQADADSADAQAFLAQIEWSYGELSAARNRMDHAVSLGPNQSIVLAVAAMMESHIGESDRALDLIERARRRAPTSYDWYDYVVALAELRQGEYEASLAAAHHWLSANPRNMLTRSFEIAALAGLGRLAEAEEAITRAQEQWPEISVSWIPSRVSDTIPFTDTAFAPIAALLRKAGLPEQPPNKLFRPVIAVLPFDNLSGEPAQEYFADGITEDIITRLARFPHLGVIASNSTFQYRGRNVDVRTVAEELGANFVLEGSMRRTEDTIRVTARLLDVVGGTHIWAESYDRDLTANDIFEVQDDITARVIGTIASFDSTVFVDADLTLSSKPPAQLSSYECLLQGVAYGRGITADLHLRFRTCLERVVEEEPELARAWSMLCFVTVHEVTMSFNPQADRDPPLERAQGYCERAVQLDPKDGLNYQNLARVLFFRHNLPAFRVNMEKAIALAPNDALVLALAGSYLTYSGDWDQGMALMQRAMALNPYHPPWYHFPSFYDAYRKGDYQTALEAVSQINMPDFFPAYIVTAAAYAQLGMSAEASRAIRTLLELRPDFSIERQSARMRLWNFEENLIEHMVDGLRKAGLPEGAG